MTHSVPEFDSREGHYKVVALPAILCMIFAFTSLLTAFGVVFALFPLLAVVLGVIAIRRIHFAPNEYTGLKIAYAGIALALFFWSTGAFAYWYEKNYSIPTGYKVISFDDLQPVVDRPGELIPEEAFALQPTDNEPDRRIFTRGYIYPGRQTMNLKEFILVPSASHCSFCTQQLKSTEMIYVELTGDLVFDYTLNMVEVGGKLSIDPAQAANPFGGLPYILKADYIR